MRKLIVILGIPIDNLSMDETLDRLEEFVQTGRKYGNTHQIVTVNTDFLVKSTRDSNLRALLQEADLATADGMPLVWGARMLGMHLKERVTGADLVPALAERAAQKGLTLYLLGAAPGVAASAARILQQYAPGLKIVGIQSPPFRPIEETDPALLEDIRLKKPDILLVAFGNPKQEKWIQRYGPELNVPVMIGVGGSLDFLAGKTRRAPRWMQRMGMEWFHRMMSEPGRLWKRYVVDLAVFSTLFLRQVWWLRRRIGNKMILPLTDIFLIKDAVIINVQGQLTVANVDGFRETGHKVLDVANHVIVNLEKTTFLDSSAIGALVGLAKDARATGGEIWLASVPGSILETLQMLRLDAFFHILPDIPSCLDACRKRAGRKLFPVVTPQV